MGIKSIALVASTLVLSTSVNAEIITYGALTTNDDGSTNLITDTLNNYEWLRFDITKDLTYAQTISILNTQDGGGWSIAGNAEAIQFIDALHSPTGQTLCTLATSSVTTCSSLGWIDGDFGNTYNGGEDVLFFLSDTSDVGYIDLQNQNIRYSPDGLTFAQSDDFSRIDYAYNISFMLYRDVSAVPVPAAVWLFGSGLIGLVGFARRKKA